MRSLTALILPTVALSAVEDPRPTLEEYKEEKANAKAEEDGEKAKQSKMAAVDKVITLFEDLKGQVLAEGEKEAAAYNKFACFCKDTTVEKQEAIQTGEDDQESLQTSINELGAKRDTLDEKIEGLLEEISDAEKEMARETKERKATLKVYEGDASDLAGAIEAVHNAIRALKSSKNPSLAQVQSVTKSVKSVAAVADALGFDGASVHRAVSMFIQADPSVPMENYKFHSGDVISTLEELQDGFRKMKSDVDAAEVKSVAEYDAFMQEKNDFVRAKNVDLDRAREDKALTVKAIEESSEQLTTISAQLLDDKEYMMQLAKICSDKAKTWDQRSKVRADELSALTSAIAIIKGTVAEKTSAATIRFAQEGVSVGMAQALVHNQQALDAVEEEAEAVDAATAQTKPMNFLQRLVKRHKHPTGTIVESTEEGRQAVISILDGQGKKMKSALLTSLASKIAADPFAKVKKLIEELIERLLHEAAAEADQKSFCDKNTAAAKGKRAHAAEKIEELNGRMAKNEAIRDKLLNEIETLQDEIEELNEKKDEAVKFRKEEKAENEATITEAEEGLTAVEEAIDIIDKFYKTSAKEEVDLGLVQTKGPLDDAPDTGFDAGEAYKGAQSESGGVLGMLDVIKSDFKRTIKETEKAEKQAERDHFDFLTETGKSLAEKNMAEEQKTKQKDNAVQELEDDGDDLNSQTKLLLSAISELLDLKPACIDTGMSYEERVARREDEIEALKKAMCIFENYAEYGPDSAGQC